MISREEVRAMLESVPFGGLQERVSVESLAFGRVKLRFKVSGDSSLTRPGGTVSGPALFALADLAMWTVVSSTRGPSPLSVTTSATIDFLRKPAPERDLLAPGEVLKNGQRLVVGRVLITSEGSASSGAAANNAHDGSPPPGNDVVAAASVTYSVPPSHFDGKGQ